MNQSLLMHVVNARANLNEEVKSRVLWEILFFPNQIKQISFACVLKSKIDSLFVFKACVKTTDVFVVELLLNSDFTNKSLLYFVWRQTCFLYLFYCNLDSGSFMPSELNFTVAAFAEVCFSCLDKFEVWFVDIAQKLFETQLFRREAALIVSFLDKRSRGFNSLHVGQQHRISSFWHLTTALKLVDFEPVLLEASLTAIFDWLTLTFGTCIERDKLLFERRVLVTRSLQFQNFFKRTHVVLALTNMDDFVIRSNWNSLLADLLLLFSIEVVQIVFQMHLRLIGRLRITCCRHETCFDVRIWFCLFLLWIHFRNNWDNKINNKYI